MQRQWMTTKMAINHQRQWKMAINHQRQWMMAVTKVAINHNQSMLQPAKTPTNTNLAIATQQYHTPSKQHIAEPMSHAQNELHILTHDAVEWVFLFGIVRLRTNSLHECHNPKLTKRWAHHCRAHACRTSTAVIRSRSYPNPITSSCHTHKTSFIFEVHNPKTVIKGDKGPTVQQHRQQSCTDIEPQLPKSKH